VGVTGFRGLWAFKNILSENLIKAYLPNAMVLFLVLDSPIYLVFMLPNKLTFVDSNKTNKILSKTF